MPFGPYILWAVRLSRSMPIASTSMGSFPAACTASVWNSTPFALHTLPISATGSTVPISLLANMTDTASVLSVMASATCSADTRPCLSTSKYVTWKPSRSSRLQVSSVALCSVFCVTK